MPPSAPESLREWAGLGLARITAIKPRWGPVPRQNACLGAHATKLAGDIFWDQRWSVVVLIAFGDNLCRSQWAGDDCMANCEF